MGRDVQNKEVTAGAEQALTKEEKKERKVGVGRMLAWQSRALAHGIGLMAIGYVTIYCTDTLGIDPGTVGMLLLASKLFDGFTDLVAGYIVDRTNTKIGRGRPYELCIIGMWLCIWGMFSTGPSWTYVLKCVWVFLMYTLINSVFYTLLTANQNAYMVRAFKHNEQYVALNTYGSIICMVGVGVFNVAMPTLVSRMAINASGWSRLMLCLAIPLILIGLLRFIFIPEKYEVDTRDASGEVKKASFSDVKQVLTKNPYIWIVAFVMVINNLVTNMGVSTYYFTYIVGDLSKMSITGAMTALGIPAVLVFPALIRKISTRNLMILGCLVAAAGYMLNFVAGANMALLSIASILTGVGCVPISMLVNLLIIDCVEYNEWKGMQRMEGTMGSVTGFATKVGSALGSWLLGVLLSASHYVANAAEMPASAMTMIRNLYGIIPAILWALVALSLLFYKLSKLGPQIQADNKMNRAATLKEE